MTPESRVRMHRLLEVWSAGGSELYDLLAHDHRLGLRRYRFGWDQGQFDRAGRFISRLNASGSSVFARPSTRLDAHPWILIDRVTEDGLALLERHAPPAVVIESALRRSEYQAWVRIDPPMARVVRKAATEFVARLVRASGVASFCWLPGTTDRDPERAPPDGVCPFVRFRSVNRRAWTSLGELEREHGFSRPGLGEVPAPIPPSVAAARRRSERDFAVAMRLIEAGHSDGAINAALEQLHTDTGGAGLDEYIQRTLRAARKRAHVRTPSGQARPRRR